MYIGLEIDDDDINSNYLRKREGQYLHSDDNDKISQHRGVFTEVNFTHVEQNVERCMIDLFNKNENENDGNMTNIHFLGALDKFNAIF